MKNYFYYYALSLALLTPISYTMEQQPPINPGSFTEQGKQYMTYSLEIWVEAADQGEVTTGLAAIFKNMKQAGIDHLINDQEALKNANEGLAAMLNDPVFQTLSNLKKIGTYEYDGAKELRSDVLRVVTQAVATNVLITACSDVKTPAKNLIQYFASYGRDSIPRCIEVLKLNEEIDGKKDAPYFGALTLILGYIAQTSANC
jgi:hypothetical protein